MSTTIHDTKTCDCEQCQWADVQERQVKLESPSPSCCPQCGSRGYCLPTCSWYPQVNPALAANTDDNQLVVPTFADAWQTAPRTITRLVTVADAEYWWLKGQQAGRIAEQVETRGWLQQMVEGYSERISKC